MNKHSAEIDLLLGLQSEMTWGLWKMVVYIVGSTNSKEIFWKYPQYPGTDERIL